MKIYRKPQSYSIAEGAVKASYPVYVSPLQEQIMSGISNGVREWKQRDPLVDAALRKLQKRGWIKNIGTYGNAQWVATGLFKPEYLSERID